MTVKQQTAEAISFLDSICYNQNNDGSPAVPRGKEVYDFAKKNGLEKATVALPDGTIHSAAALAQHIYCNAYEIGEPDERQNESYLIVALLIAMEEVSTHPWNYGSWLIYKLKLAGIQLRRDEITAFLAQEGSYASNRSKGDLLDNNLMAVSMYCARLRALYNSLPGIGRGLSTPDSDAMKELLDAEEPTAQATIEKLARKYIPALIGANNADKVERFLKYLREQSDFYIAPASTKYHMARPCCLAAHTVNVIYRTASQLLPATDAQIGEIVMAALCHDLCKNNVYVPEWKKEKVYRPEGKLYDNGGNFDWDPYLGFNFKDSMPFGHGRKSLYIAVAYFGDCLTEAVASAIDAHMHDIDTNPNVGLQMMMHPLGLWLHIGDALAAHIDEYNVPPVRSLDELNSLLNPAPAAPALDEQPN